MLNCHQSQCSVIANEEQSHYYERQLLGNSLLVHTSTWKHRKVNLTMEVNEHYNPLLYEAAVISLLDESSVHAGT